MVSRVQPPGPLHTKTTKIMKRLSKVTNWLITNSLIIGGAAAAFSASLVNHDVTAMVLAGLGIALLVFRPKL